MGGTSARIMLQIETAADVVKAELAKEAQNTLCDRFIELRYFAVAWRRNFVEKRLSGCGLDKAGI